MRALENRGMEPERDEVEVLAEQMHKGYQTLPEMEQWMVKDYVSRNIQGTGREPWVEMLKGKPLALLTLMRITNRLYTWFNSFDNLWVILLDQLIMSETGDKVYAENYPEKVMAYHILVGMGYSPSISVHATNSFIYLFDQTGHRSPSHIGRGWIDETVVVPSEDSDILIIPDKHTTGDIYPKYTSFIDIYHLGVNTRLLSYPVVLDRLIFVQKFRQLILLFGIKSLGKIDKSLNSFVFGRNPVPDWEIIINWVLSIEPDGYDYRYMVNFKDRHILLDDKQVQFLGELQALGKKIWGTVIDGKLPYPEYDSSLLLSPKEYRDILFKDSGLYDTPEKQKTLFYSELNALARAEAKKLKDGSSDGKKRPGEIIVDKYGSTPFSCVICKKETHMVDAQRALPFCSLQCRDK